MRGSSRIVLCQIFISFIPLAFCLSHDNDDESAFDPSQGPISVVRSGILVEEERNSSHHNVAAYEKEKVIDSNGYVVYCPCMGRFGNQAEQFLGSLAFARGLNRTLVLPPWIVYPSYKVGSSLQVQFKKWFRVKPLAKYHRVILMEEFMKKIADKIWPEGSRIGFCYTFRGQGKCAMKDGNPFGPFWNHFGIDFNGYQEHSGLLWNSYVASERQEWDRRYSPSQFPVLAFQGAPGDFPSLPRHQAMQKYIAFSKFVKQKADSFISTVLANKRYLAVHLRNGADMINVCKDVETFPTLFASAQCTGYAPTRQKLTREMCNPSRKEITDKIKRYLREKNLEVVFVATDQDPMLEDIRRAVGKKVAVHVRPPEDEVHDPVVDLAIMTKADLFIGNCVSTFSAFVRRHRDSRNLRTWFFGIDNEGK